MKGLAGLFCFCFLLQFPLSAQEEAVVPANGPILITIPIQRTDYKVDARYISNQILQYLQKRIGEKYPSSFTTLYKIVPSYIVTETRVIETMDQTYYADVEIYARLRGFGFFKDSLLRMYPATGSGSSEKAAIQKAANTIMAADGPLSTFRNVVDSLFHDRYHVHGDATLSSLKGLPQQTIKDCDHLLLELKYFGPFAAMEGKVTTLKNSVLQRKSDLFCTEELPKLKIKVESGVYELKETVDKLLSVSPDAGCSDDVLALAKLIGQQQLAKAAAAPDELNILVSIHQTHDTARWRSRY